MRKTEMFNLPQASAIGNSRQFLLLRTDILHRKQSVGAPIWWPDPRPDCLACQIIHYYS